MIAAAGGLGNLAAVPLPKLKALCRLLRLGDADRPDELIAMINTKLDGQIARLETQHLVPDTIVRALGRR